MRPWPKSPRYLIEIGAAFFVAAGVAWVFDAMSPAVVVALGLGLLFVAAGSIALRWEKR